MDVKYVRRNLEFRAKSERALMALVSPDTTTPIHLSPCPPSNDTAEPTPISNTTAELTPLISNRQLTVQSRILCQNVDTTLI